MKKSVLFILLIFYSNFLFSQKLKQQDIEAAIKHYPTQPLPATFKTYTVKFSNESLNPKDFPKIINPADKIVLNSFTKDVTNPDFTINIIIGKLEIYPNMTKKTIATIDELKGYSTEALIDISLPMSFEVTDKKGMLIKKLKLDNQNYIEEFNPPVTPITVKASEVLNKITEKVNTGIAKMATKISEYYDTYREPYTAEFYVIKESKTETFSDYKTAVDNLTSFYKNKNYEEADKEVAKSIAFWQEKSNTIDKSTEDGLSHYFLCLYNQATAYALLDNYEKANELISAAKETKVKSGYAGMQANKLAKLNKLKTEYFAQLKKATDDPTSTYQKSEKPYEAPSSVFELNKPVKQESEFMEKGFVVRASGDTLFGAFIEFDINFEQKKLSFLPNDGTKTVYAAPYKDIKFASTRGLLFATLGNDVLLEVVYRSSNLSVYKSGINLIFVFEKIGDVKNYTLFDKADGASYVTNYKKKLGEVFKGKCTTVENKIAQGTYELKTEGVGAVMSVIKDFETDCGSKEFEKFSAQLNANQLKAKYK